MPSSGARRRTLRPRQFPTVTECGKDMTMRANWWARSGRWIAAAAVVAGGGLGLLAAPAHADPASDYNTPQTTIVSNTEATVPPPVTVLANTAVNDASAAPAQSDAVLPFTGTDVAELVAL